MTSVEAQTHSAPHLYDAVLNIPLIQFQGSSLWYLPLRKYGTMEKNTGLGLY